MLFNYKNPKNSIILLNVAQILHVVFIILVFAFLFHVSKKLNALSSVQRLCTHGCVAILIGIGCIICELALGDTTMLNNLTQPSNNGDSSRCTYCGRSCPYCNGDSSRCPYCNGGRS